MDAHQRLPAIAGVDIVLTVGLTVVTIGLTTWAGARLAALLAGGDVSAAALVDWVGVASRLARRPSPPALAWGARSGPVVWHSRLVPAAGE